MPYIQLFSSLDIFCGDHSRYALYFAQPAHKNTNDKVELFTQSEEEEKKKLRRN
jgi:hypothetical protein